MNSRVAQALGGEQSGDLIKYFAQMDDILELNSGINDNKYLTSYSSEPPCPIASGIYTKLKLTDDSIAITNIDKSAITARVILRISWSEKFWISCMQTESDRDKNSLTTGEEKLARHYRNLITKWFVGLKASIHIFDGYRLYSNNRKTYCEQTDAIYENAITRILKPQEELDEKPDIYTTWERAVNGDECVCGSYLTLAEILTADAHNLNYVDKIVDLTVPFDDFLPLSGFTMFPNGVFGNLGIELKVGLQSNLVVCQVDPKKEFERLMRIKKLPTDVINYIYNHLNIDIPQYTRAFTQMNDKFISTVYEIDQGATLISHSKVIQFSCMAATLDSCKSNINGFNIKDSVLKTLEEKYKEKPLIIPAQICSYQSFSQKPNQTNVSCNTTYAMTNVSNIVFLFPRTSNEVTVSKNPHLSAIQLQIDGKTFPDKPFSTHSSVHTNYNITNAGLDSLFSPSEEFSYSLSFDEMQTLDGIEYEIKERNDEGQDVIKKRSEVEERNVFPYKDNTSYAFVVSTERLSGYGNFCDGLTKNNAHINMAGTLRGPSDHNPYYYNPILIRENMEKGVCNCGGEGSNSPCVCSNARRGCGNEKAPLMVLVQDCFWVLQGNEAVFVANDRNAYARLSKREFNSEEFNDRSGFYDNEY